MSCGVVTLTPRRFYHCDVECSINFTATGKSGQDSIVSSCSNKLTSDEERNHVHLSQDWVSPVPFSQWRWWCHRGYRQYAGSFAFRRECCAKTSGAPDTQRALIYFSLRCDREFAKGNFDSTATRHSHINLLLFPHQRIAVVQQPIQVKIPLSVLCRCFGNGFPIWWLRATSACARTPIMVIAAFSPAND